MATNTKIDPSKQDSIKSRNQNESWNTALQSRRTEIVSICNQLVVSSEDFTQEHVASTYSAVEKYISKYDRWFYADISNYLFNLTEREVSSYLSNLDALQAYAYSRQLDPNLAGRNSKKAKELVIAIDKLWDHSNLAQAQSHSLKNSEETFDARFDKRITPFKSEFAHEMNMQFISLIAIFTALSFIVFGGISSLDNIFANAIHVPILELMIVGCIWGICISNLVFVFVFFISKLTHISIKSTEKDNASLSAKYPFWIWSNYALLLILSVSLWLYYIDYSDSGGWLLSFSKNHELLSSICGILIIAGVFGVGAKLILRSGNTK